MCQSSVGSSHLAHVRSGYIYNSICELALIEKANEGNGFGNDAKSAIHTLFIHYITKR